MTPNELELDKILKGPVEYAKKISVEKLEAILMLFKDYYYNDNPLVPDFVYDQMEDVLRERNPTSHVLIKIGASVRDESDKVTLPYPMPSLNKAQAGAGTTQAWLQKYSGPYVVSHKLDGQSMMYYRKGGKVKLYSRGDGARGQDLTYILPYLDFGKMKIPASMDPIAIRGELIMTKNVWEKYYGDEAHVRTSVGGIIRRSKKKIDTEGLKRIRFVAYQILHPRMQHSKQFEQMEKWGMYVSPHVVERRLDEEDLLEMLVKAREKGIYQIDGLVLVNDKVAYDLTEENPKHAIAFKEQHEMAQTRVIQVLWKASKRFLMKPRVEIEPVFLSGGNLSKATGHNAKYIVDNQIGAGAIVTIARSGEVIPYIVSVDRKAKYADLPEVEYEWTEGGYDIKITEETADVSHSILVHMTKTLEIENLGPGTLMKLVEMGYTTPSEVLNITLDELKKVPGLGRNADKIWTSLLKLQTEGVWLSQLMDASSIFETGIGRKKMQLVLDNYPDILEEVEDPKLVEKLVKIKGIEQKTAEKIVNGLPKFVEFLDEVPHIRIKDEDEESESESEGAGNPALKGMRVIFTGVRDKELEKYIERSGGEVATGVSKSHKNQAVVAKDTDGSSNKLKTARELGVKIYSLTEFRKKYFIG